MALVSCPAGRRRTAQRDIKQLLFFSFLFFFLKCFTCINDNPNGLLCVANGAASQQQVVFVKCIFFTAAMNSAKRNKIFLQRSFESQRYTGKEGGRRKTAADFCSAYSSSSAPPNDWSLLPSLSLPPTGSPDLSTNLLWYTGTDSVRAPPENPARAQSIRKLAASSRSDLKRLPLWSLAGQSCKIRVSEWEEEKRGNCASLALCANWWHTGEENASLMHRKWIELTCLLKVGIVSIRSDTISISRVMIQFISRFFNL